MKPLSKQQLITAIKAAAEKAKLILSENYYQWLYENADRLNPDDPILARALAYLKTPPPPSAHLDYQSLPIVFGMLAAAGKTDKLNALMELIEHRYEEYNLPFLLTLKTACVNEALRFRTDFNYASVVGQLFDGLENYPQFCSSPLFIKTVTEHYLKENGDLEKGCQMLKQVV